MDEDDIPGETRSAAFAGGAESSRPGGYAGPAISTASSIQQTVQREFTPQSVLTLPNMIRTPNGMSEETYAKKLPMDNMLRQSAGEQQE